MNIYPFFDDLFTFMESGRLKPWRDELIPLLEDKFQNKPHGDLNHWFNAFNNLPEIRVDNIELNQSFVGAGSSDPIDEQTKQEFEKSLKALIPWRKGPYDLFGIRIETEWRSDMKWQRIENHISSLKHRTVLDVGCGSGYHCWRMLGAGAKRVIGIDPNLLFLMQFESIKKYCGINAPIHLLPVRMEDVTPNLESFDTTFSMGILYHRRSPIDHLLELKSTLVKGGELVLETLICEGNLGYTLIPEDRYAMMRNVWSIPSIQTLELWLRKVGFKDIRHIESNQTTCEEQRTTDWMQFQSLSDFLDPEDSNKTIEGYPAPKRATFVATK